MSSGVLMGFDYGTHKIGIAVGQALTGTATALTTLGMVNRKPDWHGIEKLLDEWQPQALVVGHPFEMTDREANNAAGAKKFARQLHGRFQLPVHMADERLTSREAWSRLGSDAGKDPTRVDAFAAKLILETWLND
jgi:putative Holliday junction resolvase